MSRSNGGRSIAMPPRLEAKIETITPEIAQAMLSTQQHNRPVRQRKVTQYAREMVQGHWRLNGEPLIFDDQGSLMDGQHRLSAVIMAQHPIPMFVVRGVPREAMQTIDTGITRNYGDVTALRGESASYGAVVAAVARVWFMYDEMARDNRRMRRMPLAHQEIDAIVEQHPVIPAAAHRAARSSFRRYLPASAGGFVFGWLSENADPDIAELFLSTVEKGADLRENDPIFALRRRLLDMPRREVTTVAALMIKAYNEWIAGASVKILTFREDEAFPRFGVGNREARKTRLRRGLKREPAAP